MIFIELLSKDVTFIPNPPTKSGGYVRKVSIQTTRPSLFVVQERNQLNENNDLEFERIEFIQHADP